MHPRHASRVDFAFHALKRACPKSEVPSRPRPAYSSKPPIASTSHFAQTTFVAPYEPEAKRRKVTESAGGSTIAVSPRANEPDVSESPRQKRPSRPAEPCRYWKLGGCREGANCPFDHDGEPGKRTEVCKFFKTGFCRKEGQCPFSHDLTQVACNNILLHNHCVYGNACKFSHDEHVIASERLRQVAEKDELERNQAEGEARQRELRALPFLASPFGPVQPQSAAPTKTSSTSLFSLPVLPLDPNAIAGTSLFHGVHSAPPPPSAADELERFL
jgi:hypothetical protein